MITPQDQETLDEARDEEAEALVAANRERFSHLNDMVVTPAGHVGLIHQQDGDEFYVLSADTPLGPWLLGPYTLDRLVPYREDDEDA